MKRDSLALFLLAAAAAAAGFSVAVWVAPFSSGFPVAGHVVVQTLIVATFLVAAGFAVQEDPGD